MSVNSNKGVYNCKNNKNIFFKFFYIKFYYKSMLNKYLVK